MFNIPLRPRLLLLVFAALLASCGQPAKAPGFGAPVPITLHTGPTSEGPRLSRGSHGRLVLSWMERLSVGGGTLHYSALADGRWQGPGTVINDPKMFVNWADIPSVVPLAGDTWFAHWLSKSASATYAYDVNVSHSFDDGVSWSEPVTPHDDGSPTEHGFVSIARGRSSTQLVWLDGRKTARESTGNLADTGMTLRSANVDKAGNVTDEQLIDGFVCDCCRTDIAITEQGPVAVYRDRTPDEIRDIYISRRINGEWQPGVRLSHDDWKIPGCPVNGPAIAASGGLVAVAWFTAADDKPRVQLRISTDAGKHFGEPVLISDNAVMGQVDIEIVDDRGIAVSWLEKRSASIDVRLMSLSPAGATSPGVTIGHTSYMRAVPQMALFDGALVFAWTDAGDGGTRIVSIRVPFSE